MEQLIKNRKGEMGSAFNNVLLVCIIGILFVVVIYVFGSLATTFYTSTGVTVVNESTFANSTGDQVSAFSQRDFAPVSFTAVNASSGTVITSNVSLSSAGVVGNTTIIQYNRVNLTYAYTYNADTSASNASADLNTNFSNQVPLVGILVAVVLISAIIGLLIVSFFKQGNKA